MSPQTAAIRDAFRRTGWTQAQLAARAEKSPRVIWDVLQGFDTKASSVYAVCRALGISSLPVPQQLASSREIAL